MAFWNGEEIRYFKPYPAEKEGWVWIDCGCCNGLRWGGEIPIECNDCDGTGMLCLHINSGSIGLYPGGPFKGSYPKEYVEKIMRGKYV